MYLVRDPGQEYGGDSHYREGADRSDAFARAGMVESCTRCGRALERASRVVLEYPSANPGSDDIYLTVTCWDCAAGAIKDVRHEADLRSGDHFAYPNETCGVACGCGGLESSDSCLADASCSSCIPPRGLNEHPLNDEDHFVDHGGQYAGY